MEDYLKGHYEQSIRLFDNGRSVDNVGLYAKPYIDTGFTNSNINTANLSA